MPGLNVLCHWEKLGPLTHSECWAEAKANLLLRSMLPMTPSVFYNPEKDPPRVPSVFYNPEKDATQGPWYLLQCYTKCLIVNEK